MENKRQKFINFRPALYIAIFQIIGILSAYFLYTNKTILGIIFISVFSIADIIFFILFLIKNNKGYSIFCIFLLVVALLGGMLFTIKVDNYKNANLNNHFYIVYGKVYSVTPYDDYTSIILDDVELTGVNGGKTNYKVLLIVNDECSLDIGDYIKYQDRLTDRTLFYEGRFCASYIDDDVKYFSDIESDDIVFIKNQKNCFESINVFIRDSIKAGMEEEWSVPYALLTGVTGFMDDDVLTNFRNSGVAHIFAVSGLHIGFLATVLYFILDKLKIKKFLRTIIVVGCCLFYSGICGFTASSIRATIMCGVLGFSNSKGERYDALSSISIASIIILFVSPLQLFRAGFVLSFSVVLGILLLSRPIKRLLKFLPDKIGSAISSATAAEIVSFPISLVYFGKSSVLAVLVNIILIPMISVVFTAMLIATIVGGLFSIESIVMFPLKYVFIGIRYAIAFVDGKLFLVEDITVGISLIFYFLMIIVLSGLLNIKKGIKAITVVVLLMATISSGLYLNLKEDDAKLYVCGDDKICATLIVDECTNILVISDMSYTITGNRLNRLSNNCTKGRLDAVIILEGENDSDMHRIATSINKYFKFNNLFYFGEKQEDLEGIIEQSFKNTECVAFNDKNVATIGDVNIKYLFNGTATNISIKDKEIAIFSALSKTEPKYTMEGKTFDIIVANNYLYKINLLYNPKTMISYRRSEIFIDGETEGDLIFNI